ncbi:MAG TPA: malto-oligosyltrehalose synthase [Polyangiaceae bacterium]|nr:malto-oligosyltrehalose synthase [Polyangiaceae bacterium]
MTFSPASPERRFREPRASYRLQLGPGFGFMDAARVARYLRELGVSHAYLSPVLQAAPGSTHGYDVVDHTRVSDDLGGPEAYRALSESLEREGLGQLVDIVPNHMAIDPKNPWWWDVLENGPSGVYASYFDVEWSPPEHRLRDKVLLPILGDHSGRVIDAGEIRVVREGGAFTIRYYEHRVPVAPRSLAEPLARAAASSGSSALGFLADAFGGLPLPTATDPESQERRHRDKQVLVELLERLTRESPEVAAAIDRELEAINASPDELDRFLSRQNCRLAYWRAAAQDLGYRRFFDISSLVGLRAENPRVFAATHARIREFLEQGIVHGVRVDHIDGLRNPLEYLERLRGLAGDAWILVEKILEPGERLRSEWPIDGTTGYDFLNELDGLFVRPESKTALLELYAELTGEPTDYVEVVRDKKHLVLRDLLGSDLNRLTQDLLEVCEENRRFRDYSRHEVHEALQEVLACFPVYRTYVDPDRAVTSEEDARVIRRAIQAAKDARPDLDAELLDFLERVLTLDVRGARERELVARFQQTSGPVMAKGVEDTVFYCYVPFVALNEVGGAPNHFGRSLTEFHEKCRERQRHRPYELVTTSTHDTKRGEDVRMRLMVLSEMPEAWRLAVLRWSAHNERHRKHGFTDANTEYLFYQTLVGAFPLSTERAKEYMLKAARESKRHTSWTRMDETYERALVEFVERTLDDREFVSDVEQFAARIIPPGRVNSLAHKLVQLTVPGVPDLYQGSELWNLSLVDPDNRRPVDYDVRRRLLAELEGMSPDTVLARADEGLPKLHVVREALQLRRRRPEAFGPDGDYEPLFATGERRDHVIAFVRGGAVITVVTRWPVLLSGGLGDTRLGLPEGRFRNLLTGDVVEGGEVPLNELVRAFPVCLLERQGA